jgi:hypothetical protein
MLAHAGRVARAALSGAGGRLGEGIGGVVRAGSLHLPESIFTEIEKLPADAFSSVHAAATRSHRHTQPKPSGPQGVGGHAERV